MREVTVFETTQAKGYYAQKHRTYDMENGVDVAKYIARNRFAWPGGYELAAITNDGELLCHRCCRSEFPQIAYACKHGLDDGWRVVGICSTDSRDEELWHCAHCGNPIGQ